MKINITIHFRYLLLSLAAFAVAALTLAGKVQEVIHFRDALNEIALFIFSGTAGILTLILSFSKNR